MDFKNLFSPGKIGNVKIKNRIVRSATYERMASKEGHVTDKLVKLYTDLAQGGTGLIITGFILVDLGHGGPRMAHLYDDSFIPGQKKLVKATHDYSDVKIAAQLGHTGRQGTHPRYGAVAPSPIQVKYTGTVPRELKYEEIQVLIKKFVDAGRRAYEIGYDMVQMHAAHDYLLSNFISPYANRRTDEFGGNTEKRTKILIDIFNELRDEVGKNWPIMIKLQTTDGIPGGLTTEEAKTITKILVDTGYDAIEPSGGGGEIFAEEADAFPSKKVKSPYDENYFLPTAKDLRVFMKEARLILVGGIRNPISVEKTLREDLVDFISMCRPLIREPNLPNRWKEGDTSPARCISCNLCFATILSGSLHCVVERKLERKKQRQEKKFK